MYGFPDFDVTLDSLAAPLDRRQKAVEIEVLGACIANRRQQAGGKEKQAGVNGAFGG